jgi:hypothetical protein
MLLNDVADSFSQSAFTGHLHPILHMGDEDKARHRRSEMVMFILTPSYVFNEVKRLFQLSDVMIIGAHPCQKGIGIVNGPGTIDADYRGEIGVLLINFGKDNPVYQLR